jgi:copper homeostasis protein
MREIAAGKQLAMHRAFDLLTDPYLALEQLVGMGFDRVLSSGLAKSAWDGAGVLRRLHLAAADRIAIMPGGGVNAKNAAEIIHQTGCRELHGSFRLSQPAAGSIANFGQNCPLDTQAIALVASMLDKGTEPLPT